MNCYLEEYIQPHLNEEEFVKKEKPWWLKLSDKEWDDYRKFGYILTKNGVYDGF